jgi:hypothetical protein
VWRSAGRGRFGFACTAFDRSASASLGAFGREVRFSTPRRKTLRLRSGQALSVGTPAFGPAFLWHG